ncbi:hypothetical protein GCM10009682_23870 [Luedemannella flava]|uniref:Protein kinase domain-containing protein n=1 Tax=Luedemannella flava TaxID=349316 RepID=A0ABP4Y4I5_9ACTN
MQPLKSTDPAEVGPYRLLGRLGSGGMGVVYLGKSRTADLFAIKMITQGLAGDVEFRTRFAAEVDTLRTVSGTRVARLERADLDADPPWLAVEFVAGRSLQTQVEVNGPLSPRAGAMLGALLVEGLRSVHAAGLVHRDLKPANIMLGPYGPMVIDFGLAVLRERDHHLTGTGLPVGTLAYMSPEQARGERDLSTATDVYALGATLVYALTGHTVFAQGNAIALLKRIDDPDDLPDTSGVPADLAALIDGMLGYEPSTRPTLDTVFDRLIAVATAGGVRTEEVRADLARQTFVNDPLDLPDEALQPEAEDSDTASVEDDPTRLVSLPSRPEPEPAALAPADEPAPRPQVPAADVGWLAEEMRTAYARGAAL